MHTETPHQAPAPEAPSSGGPAGQTFGPAEVGLAARNHGMPLEALRYDVTPAGLHYLLIHFDVPATDAATWRLEVTGAVARRLSLSPDDLRAMERTSVTVTLECAGNGRAFLDPRPVSQPWGQEAVGTATWAGVPLSALLDAAGLGPEAVEIVFAGVDRGIDGGIEQTYERALSVADASSPDVLVADEMNGAPLPPQHGFPLRLVVPGWYGMASVKWLRSIRVLDAPFRGYQNARAYRIRQTEEEDGRPVSRIQPRSLMVPPGMPEFLSRDRIVEAGRVQITGRAWSGWGAIERVEFSDDGGATWADAELGTTAGRYAWRVWSFDWDAVPGAYELCSRTTDSAGNVQPLEAPWNLGGYSNNAVQRVKVDVRGGGPA